MSDIALPSLRTVSHSFAPEELCAGHVVLDFVNTAAGLNRDPRDWLDDYQRLLEWSALAGVADRRLLGELERRNHADLNGGQAALGRARELRAALYELVHCRRQAMRPSDASVEVLQQWCRRGAGALDLWSDERGELRRSYEACGLDMIAASIALGATDFLSQPMRGSLGVCAGQNCGWVFLDPSETRRRRWCDMRTCGNAAKASRHYQRKRERA